MPPTALFAKLTLPDVDHVAADEATNGFAFTGADPVAVGTAIKAFCNTPNTTQPMAGYLGNSRDRAGTPAMIQVYDISTTLHGEPHGTPIHTEFFALAPTSAGDLPDQVAAVLSYHADVTALPEHGALAVRPTDEEAQDEGAPATHTVKSRPRSSLRGRLFWGPLSLSCMAADGGLTTFFVADATAALHRLATLPIGTGIAWAVWSRTYGTLDPINGGWITFEFGTQRRRRDRSLTRVDWV